jgi:hypothetical protein
MKLMSKTMTSVRAELNCKSTKKHWWRCKYWKMVDKVKQILKTELDGLLCFNLQFLAILFLFNLFFDVQ